MKNDYYVDGSVTWIKVRDNIWSQVDTGDLDIISRFDWRYYNRNGHESVVSSIIGRDKKEVIVSMHRLICKFPDGLVVDHINHDSLDNRSSNLRSVTVAQNSLNRSNKNKFVGVNFCPTRKKWRARIKHNGSSVFHKRFDTKEEAVNARAIEFVRLFGRDANPDQTVIYDNA